MRGDTDHLNAAAIIGRKLFDVVVAAHGHGAEHGAAGVFGQQTVQLFNVVAHGDIGIIAFHIAQKADLHNIHTGTHQTVNNVAGVVKAPVPVVDISAVPQGAVQQFAVIHEHSLSSLKSLLLPRGL